MKTLEELIAQLQDPSLLSADDLNQVEADLNALYQETRNAKENLDATDIDVLEKIRDLRKSVTSELEVRAQQRAELEAKLAELDAEMTPAEEADAEGETEADAEVETEEADPAEAETEAETEAESADADASAEAEDTNKKKVAVAASGKPKPLAQLAQKAGKPDMKERTPRVQVLTPTDVVGASAGSPFTSREQIYTAFANKIRAHKLGGGGAYGAEQVTLASIQGNFPANRDVSGVAGDPNAAFAFLDAARNDRAPLAGLTAAGGICGPTQAYYDTFSLVGTTRRPVRDAMTSVKNTRGQITFNLPLALSGVNTGTGSPNQAFETISETTMRGAHTKVYEEIDCGSEKTVVIEAMTKILQFGNLNAIAQPERIKQILDQTEVAFARYAENRLLTLINAESTQLSEQQDAGVSRDLVNYIRRLVGAIRFRNRLGKEQAFTALIPRWILDAYEADVLLSARGMNGKHEISEEEITAMLGRAGVRVVWTDESLNNPFSAEVTSTKLDNYPTTVKYIVYPEGTWVHLDAGQIDLGLVRDSTLNLQNKFQTFYESFETVAKVGLESYTVTQTFCVNGGAVADLTDANTICDGGS